MSPSAPRGAPEVAARRVRDTPIVEYGSVPGYGAIFNAGAIEVEGVLHLFARGVREGYRPNPGPGARFLDYVSDVLVFTSRDGFDFEFQPGLRPPRRCRRRHDGLGPLRHGPEHATVVLDDLPGWMARKEFATVDELRNRLAVPSGIDETVYERAGQIDALREANYDIYGPW